MTILTSMIMFHLGILASRAAIIRPLTILALVDEVTVAQQVAERAPQAATTEAKRPAANRTA